MCLVHGAVLFAGALGDLDQAIALSGCTGRTACQALVQRGLLHRLARQNDEARADFEKAAALGSEFARQQAVVLNPYAALCNKMLSEVINKMRNPETSDMQWCKTLGVRLLWKSEINKLTFLWCSLNSVHCAALKKVTNPAKNHIYSHMQITLISNWVVLITKQALLYFIKYDTCSMWCNLQH